MQGDQPTEKAAVPIFQKGGEKLFKAPLMKGGGHMMITYGELMQTIGVIVAIAGFIVTAIKVNHDIKKK